MVRGNIDGRVSPSLYLRDCCSCISTYVYIYIYLSVWIYPYRFAYMNGYNSLYMCVEMNISLYYLSKNSGSMNLFISLFISIFVFKSIFIFMNNFIFIFLNIFTSIFVFLYLSLLLLNLTYLSIYCII